MSKEAPSDLSRVIMELQLAFMRPRELCTDWM
jgi:hypothetical protein